MTVSKKESALLALVAALSAVHSNVKRNQGVSQSIDKPGAAGLIVVHDGDPGEPEVTLSPMMYHYEHLAEVDVIVQGKTADAAFDALAQVVADAILADRTLGGAVDYAEPMAADTAELPEQGAQPIKAGTIRVMLVYSTTNPLK